MKFLKALIGLALPAWR